MKEMRGSFKSGCHICGKKNENKDVLLENGDEKDNVEISICKDCREDINKFINKMFPQLGSKDVDFHCLKNDDNQLKPIDL